MGRSFTAPPACGPRICTHQPLLTKLFTILDAKENAALVQRYFSWSGPFHLLDIVEAAHRHGVRTIRQPTQHARHHQADVAGVVGFTKRFPANIFRTDPK